MSSSETRAWLCGECGHFVVRDDGGSSGAPFHDCPVAGRTVTFVPYESSEQADDIRRRLPPTSRRSQ